MVLQIGWRGVDNEGGGEAKQVNLTAQLLRATKFYLCLPIGPVSNTASRSYR